MAMKKIVMISVTALVAIVTVIAEEYVKPQVTSINPHEGSYKGATRLYIHGKGFSSSGNFGVAGQNPNLGNKAFLVSDFESVPCDVENDASHETMIVCYTRPMRQDQHYFIKVIVDGVEVPFNENCNRRARDWRCRFIPRWWKTPYIWSAGVSQEGVHYPMQTAFSPGSLITLKGRIYTQIFGSNNQTNENGKTVSIRRIYMGGTTCELLSEPDVFYSLKLTNGDEGEVTCKPTSTFVGPQNFSLILTDDYGRATKNNMLMKVNSKGKVYNFETYGEITGVSPSIGSLQGGTRVVIEGRNFDETTEPITVYIGRVPCEVIPGTVKDTSVECIAGDPPPETMYYPGSRGIFYEEWNETTWNPDDIRNFESSRPSYNRLSYIDSAAYKWNDEYQFSARYTGIIVIPHDDVYMFMIAGDDRVSLFVNCEGKKENLTKMAFMNSHSSSYETYPSQKSEWMSLQRGQECYFVATVTDYGGAGYLFVGVQWATTTLTAAQSFDAKNELQVVDFSAKYDDETQIVNFTGWSSQSGVVEVQEVTIQHACINVESCGNVAFRLGYEGVMTTIIQADASGSIVKNALKDISELKDEDISVSDLKSNGKIVYTVKFQMKRADYSALTYAVYPPGIQGLTISVEETVKGVSEQKTFKLRLGGRATPPISQTFNEENLAIALDATRYAFCPGYLLPDRRKSTVVTTKDFEGTKYFTEYGSRKTNIEPFCGEKSSMNNDWIYYAGRTADNADNKHGQFNAAVNKWLCLAHRGLFHQSMLISATFKSPTRTWTADEYFDNPLITHKDEWRYSCIDLMEVVHSRHVDVYECTIKIIRLIRKDKYNNFYIDAMTIGSSKVTEDIDGVVGLRTPPALANGHPIKSVLVTKKDTDVFSVKIDTHECGDQLPLITMTDVAFGLSVERTVSGTKPMTGYFDLTIRLNEKEYNITDIPVDILEEAFEARLESEILGFGQAKVTRRGGCHAREYHIEWVSNGGDKPQMDVHFHDVNGASDLKANVITKQNGGIQEHISGDMLRLPYDEPQVEVFVNGYPSKCVGSCKFTTAESATPVISSISASSGSPGTSVTITGTNLDPVGSSKSTVKIGETDCSVTTNTATSIGCNLLNGPVGVYELSLNVGGKGLARKESESVSLSFTITGSVTSINPSSGFKTGGTIVTISGNGFSRNTTFTFGSSQCEVISVTATSVKCRTPEHATTTGVTVTAKYGMITLGTATFNYLSTNARVSSISPLTSTLNGGGSLILNGQNLNEEGIVVYIGNEKCEISESTASKIICELPSAMAGEYAVKVAINDKGYADGSHKISYVLRVDSVSPTTASRNGGSEMTITGTGFTEGKTMVKIKDVPCTITSLTNSKIECISGPTTKMYRVTNNGRHATQGTGYAWDSLVLDIEAGDTVTWQWKFEGAEGGWNWGARVFTTATADSNVYDELGFQSSPEKSQEGSFSYTFYVEGTYYISSGKVDHPDWGSVVMKQSIVVHQPKTESNKVSVTVAGFEADYNTGGPTRRRRSTCTPVTIKTGCTSELIQSESGHFVLTTGHCYTPTVTAISTKEGYKDREITITGDGFAPDNCANKVLIGEGKVGEYNCIVTSSSSTEIKCKIAPEGDTPLYTAFEVTVQVSGLGYSSAMIKADSDRRFTLLPSISSVSPPKGSLSGGTLLTIAGAGLSSVSSVQIGGYLCNIENATYFEIKCRTTKAGTVTARAASAGTVAVIAANGQNVHCLQSCNFTYDAASTPQIMSVTPSKVSSENTTITLNGTSLTEDTAVTIGPTRCTRSASTSTSTSITCTIQELPAGNHLVQVLIPGKGNAEVSSPAAYVESTPLTRTMSPVNGSREGGTIIKFTGNGFNCKGIRVKLSNKDCIILKASLTNFEVECMTVSQTSGYRTVDMKCENGRTFTAPSQFRHHGDVTPEIHAISPTTGAAGSTVTITGELFDHSNMKVMVGDAECESVSGNSTQITCTLAEHAGGEYPVTAVVSPFGNAKSDLRFNYSYTITSVDPIRGSFAGRNLLTISGTGFGNQSIVHMCGSVCQHGESVSGTRASYKEIICRVPAMSEYNSVDKVCNVSISVNGQSVVQKDSYTFATDQTPRVTSISPERGGTQGGTQVTIQGTLFDADADNVKVEIGGVNCNVTSSNVTTILCTTNARGHSLLADIVVTIAGKGQALSNTSFYYIDVWSSNYTWGGESPPIEGDFVVVPMSQTLLIDQDTPVLKMLLIQGGKVIFDDKDIHLQTENILITDGGSLQIGTEEAPFQHKAVITLHGHLRSKELPIYGTKTIGVRNGTLDLHGKHIPITWTHLTQTANAGTDTLHLKHAVTWNVGDEIVLASTGLRHSQKENEKRKITAISDDKMQLTLDKPLNYTHISVSEKVAGVDVETHGEVGLLTRNIVIEGSVHMDWSKDKIPACPEGFDTGEFKQQTCFQGRFGEEEGSDQFGGQIMIHHRAPGLGLARARIEYVELRNMGQAFRLGRYPIHFHLLGDVSFNSYVRGCAIHKTFNRAITIHNTHHLLIQHNVIFDVMGGAVFIEDGIEHGNKIEYNLVVFCKQSTSLQNDDITPAAFWVTNPNNTLQHNAAAGGTHFGFWYRIHATPDGPSADSSICQQLHPIEKFANNTVHSQGWFGLWVFQKYTPKGDGSCGSIEPTIARYDSMLVWNCEKGAELVNVGAIQFHNFVMVHNEKAGIETKLIVDNKVKWGQAGTYNSTIIGRTAQLREGCTERGMILPFTEGYEVKSTTFANFESNCAAIGVTKIDGTCSVLCGGWEARFSDITFQNSPNKAIFRWEHEVSLRDMDGSLAGTAGSIITPYNPTLPSTCTDVAGFGTGDFRGVKCDNVKKFHRVSWNNAIPISLTGKDVSFTTDSGSSFIPFAKKRLTHKFGWMGTMIDGETYKWVFENAQQLTNISYEAGFYNFKEDDCVIVSHNLTQKPDKFYIAGDNKEHAQSDMVTCQDHYHGDYYFDPATFNLYYIVSGRDRVVSSRKKRAIQLDSATSGAVNREVKFKVFRCFYEKCIPPPDPNNQPPARVRPDVFQIWHEFVWKLEDKEYKATLEDDGIVTRSTNIPLENQDIRIGSGIWMVVKKELPKMKKLWIEGVLEIEWNDPSLNVTLSATHILIMGGRLIIGWEDASFRGIATIVLRGNHNTPGTVLNGGADIGSKAIGVLGGLDLHGKKRNPLKTHLANPLSKGERTITLEDSPTDWKTGDEVVIATTSADPWETETFKIVSVSEKVVTLNDSAKFDHIAKTFTHEVTETDLKSYDIRAEVSILTRNIKVIGEENDDLFRESFGARILVTKAGQARGYARISNVEFHHTGQEGWIENYDPRFSLSFLNSGSSDLIKPSSVKQNTFHNGFNTAIGVFGAANLTVSDNVIHHTVGPGIRIEGSDISVEDNLVMLTRTRTVYKDREESDLLLWKAAIEANLATRPVLKGNVVVGSERAGYRIDGHNCDSSANPSDNVEWGYNTARATLHGVWMNKDGFPVCNKISKFRIHNAYDGGIFYQSMGSLVISDVLVTDSVFAITPIVYSPTGLSHVFQDKSVRIENSVIVAVSEADYCPTLDQNMDYLKNSDLARGILRKGASRIGILWPAFISSQNAAPSKPFLGSMSYPAIGGRTEIHDVAFVNFGDTSCSINNTAIVTNMKVEDFLHPIYTSQLQFVNSPENSKIFWNRPSLGAINPSDCVDMECDGMKKALLVDNDGSMIGGLRGSIIPQAEYEWDGDPVRGLGDYRIPKTLLTNPDDGSRIPVDEIAPYKGILRANTSATNCVSQEHWQAHKCIGYHHGILVIESMDTDTETRRLSPVALLANSYIDLNNGPQDHGWCAGYTCQERLSTFWTIVAFSQTYELHFSGTSPQKLRFRILNEDSTAKMVVKLFSTRPQRLDVFTDNVFTGALNYRNKLFLPPNSTHSYLPTITDPPGANFFDRTRQLLHITIAGGSVIEIREAELVVITFNMPAVTPDEFFDNGNLVRNLALFLDIPESKIRVVNVIREGTARRRRRDTSSVAATVEIGDSPEDVANSTSAGNSTSGDSSSMSIEDLANVTSTITNALQENTIEGAIGARVLSLDVVDARAPATRNANITNTTDSETDTTTYYIPASIRIVQQPMSGSIDTVFSDALKVVGVDANGIDIVLGHSSDPWQATVTIASSTVPEATVSEAIAYFNNSDNHAEFENLTLSHEGEYILRIQVTYPSSQSGLTVDSSRITVTNPVAVNPVADNRIAIIVGATLGGALIIILIAVFLAKGPFFRASKTYKVNTSRSAPSKKVYSEIEHTPHHSTVNVNNEVYEETPPNSVTDLKENMESCSNRSMTPIDKAGGHL